MSRCTDLGRVGRVSPSNLSENESRHVELGTTLTRGSAVPLAYSHMAPIRLLSGSTRESRSRFVNVELTHAATSPAVRGPSLGSSRLTPRFPSLIRTQMRDAVLRAVSRRLLFSPTPNHEDSVSVLPGRSANRSVATPDDRPS